MKHKRLIFSLSTSIALGVTLSIGFSSPDAKLMPFFLMAMFCTVLSAIRLVQSFRS